MHIFQVGRNGFAYIKNPFTANAQILQTVIGTHEELVKLQYDGFACNVYFKK